MATVILPTWYKNKTTGLDILLSVESIQSLSVGEAVQNTYYTPKITCTPSSRWSNHLLPFDHLRSIYSVPAAELSV